MKRLFLIFLIVPFLLLARGKIVYQQVEKNILPPWLTGPLLAPAALVVPGGYCNIEPYIFADAYTGNYSSDWKAVDIPTFWINYLQVLFQVGLTQWMDFQFIPTVFWNYTQHQASWQLGDLTLIADFQLYASRPGSPIPSVKLALREIVPIGKYRNLDPKKLGTTDGGAGTWATAAGVVFGHIYHITSVYYFNYRLFLNYEIPAPVHVKEFNFYGGGIGTDARMFPPQHFSADLGMEVTIAQTWALALDIYSIWSKKGRFTGHSGFNLDGTPASLGRDSQIQYSLAPAIEYNWNANAGIIAGSWFTIAGKNSPVFASAVLAANFYF